MPHPLTPAQLLQHMEVTGEPKVFVLGCFERRVTLWAQQHRALNLVYSLHHEGLLTPGTQVAVIGGGVAGLTVAAAAEQKGGLTTLFEKQPQLLHLLQGNHTRWVHPRIYDWPAPGSESANAGLPLLNWEADLAGEVAEQLLAGFNRAAAGCRLLTGVQELTVVPGSLPKRQVTWRGGEAKFDIVILAVGFGVERTLNPLPLVSYWRDESLHQPELTSGVRSYLVSGCGDGGLTDLLRIRLTRFRHERVVRELLSDTPIEPLKARLFELEQDLTRQPESTRPAWLTDHYRSLPVPSSLDEKLRSRLRQDTRATLNGTGPFALDPGSSVLNRFLAWRLLSIGDVAYESGRVTDVASVAAGYEVRFSSGRQTRFDQLVVRHGPIPAIENFSIAGPHLDELRARGALDQTRLRMWSDGFYTAVHARLTEALIPPAFSNPGATGRPISDVFSTRGVPLFNFVEPPRFDRLKDKLRAKGRGLIVEGPSGIGKTATVKKAIQTLQPPSGFMWIKGYDTRDRGRLEAILDTAFTGHLIVDDVLQLQAREQARLIEEIRRIYDDNGRETKITLIGDSGTGDSLMASFPALGNCIEVHTLHRQPDVNIGKLIRDGQQESNLRFARTEKLVKAARGSCFIAQQLCEKAASIKNISMAPSGLVDVEIEMEALIDEMMIELLPRYQHRLLDFAAVDRGTSHPGACVALLALLCRSAGDKLAVVDAHKRHPELASTFVWLRNEALGIGVQRYLNGLVTYDSQPEILTLQDPRLGFYLQHLAWVEFARQMGRQIGLGPNGELIFP